jgi:F-type H+-transporting ATPase subunit epsilon
MLEDKILLEIVAPDRMVLSERVDEVVVPGEEGEFGVMPQHTPFLTSLRIGTLTVYNDGKQSHLVVGKGIVEVTGSKVTILTQQAAREDEIDLAKAQQEEKELQEKLSGLTREDPDSEEIRDKWTWASYQIKVASKK